MLAPEVIQPMGLAEPPRPDWRLRVAGATLSMQDASMRSQMGLEEQSAPHLVPAMCSVIPAYGALSGTDAFSGAEDTARGALCRAERTPRS